jgi:Lrp/AsnC family leucine-responsive transcriptional regulator
MFAQLDAVDRRLIAALQREGRLPFTELGRKVGLSSPAVAERVRRLETLGVIRGYRCVVDPARIGQTIVAYVRFKVNPGMLTRAAKEIERSREVLECHRLTGADCFLIRIVVSSVAELERFTDRLLPFGAGETSLVLSSLVADRPVQVDS